ncbi:hypothetical protein HPP92_003286 [Vanilla planifolia]|uniref:Fe2OG dioxygenase domain-containing protein n=1 Tax=Vanilla planifolia TaxID=51239 RepID=A0A835VJM9_VANPL|nr:hypothetical protein HPP92_003677 [Vanilla planifolia]KAG0503214.1 hypothetical protein HPP92_003286 [Vanilla planifolia]
MGCRRGYQHGLRRRCGDSGAAIRASAKSCQVRAAAAVGVLFGGTPAVSLHLRSPELPRGSTCICPGSETGISMNCSLTSAALPVSVLNWAHALQLSLIVSQKSIDLFQLSFTRREQTPASSPLVLPLNRALEEYGRHMARIVQCYFLEYSHTDSSVLTIVDEDEVGGLQIRHGNSWFHIKPVFDTFLVQLGDMMQAISNDEYKSVEHRVLANERKERLSLCYFTFPREDFRIKGMC